MVNKNNKKTIVNLLNKEQAEAVGKELLIKMAQNPGMTLKEATGVSEEALEEIYSLAYTFYNQGKYREAIPLFQFLAGAAPDTYKYVLGLAASCHQVQAYEQAAIGFFIALRLDPENPLPAYYAMDCFLKQNLLEEALEFAEVAVMICDEQPEYAELKKRCELIINSLNSNK